MLEITLPRSDGHEVKITGEIDAYSAPRLRAVLQLKLKEQHPRLCLDCSDLSFIDSRGLAALQEYARDAREFNGRLELRAVQSRVRDVLELVRLDSWLDTHLPGGTAPAVQP
jgi:anti-sigma B factor antagonist